MKLLRIRPKRGLSTVVTTAILLSAVSIMGIYLVGWSNSSLLIQQLNLENSFNDKLNKLNEDIFIENVWFNDDPYTVNVTINNVGVIGLNVTQIKLVNSSDTAIFVITDGGVLPKNTYSFQDTYVWLKNEIIDIYVTTARDRIFTTQVTADN
ncbi:MAG: hypothetical protein IH842_00900 [Thaumarchaeota archaeon]|nr:hypothetical protein [Nitrososphaerota archaeon]